MYSTKHFTYQLPVRILVVALVGLACCSTPLKASEELSQAEKVSRLRGDRAEKKASLDVGLLGSAGAGDQMSLQEAKSRAGVILNQILLEGGGYEAVHVVTYARLTNDLELEGAIRQRLQRSDSSWTEQHVKLGALHALVVMKGERFSEEISGFLQSNDETLRTRAYMLARDSKDESLLNLVKQRVAQETDESVKMAGLSAVAAVEGSGERAYLELVEIAKSDRSAASRAVLEIDELDGRQRISGSGSDEVKEKKLISKETEEKLKLMAVSGQHDQRMYAIDTIAAQGSESAKGWMRRMGESEHWQQRLNSAYFLLKEENAAEAKLRLETEDHPLVQVTLLATLRTNR